MENTAYIALTRQAALDRQMDVIANNIANAATTAYKGEHMMFAELLQNIPVDGSRDLHEVAFVQDLSVIRDLQEGPMERSGNTFDFAIKGNGYFELDTADGARYTRNGRFELDADGMLVSSHGHAVLSADGAPIVIELTATEITVGRDGTVSTENGDLGRIKVVRFENERLLEKTGDRLYRSDVPALGDGEPDINGDTDSGEILQGTLEGSNVQPIIELTRMLQAQRAYVSAQRMIVAEDDRIKEVIDTVPTSN